MSKQCAKCDYKLEDMCRFWQCWRKHVALKNCYERFIKRARDEGAVQYLVMGLGQGTHIKDRELFDEIYCEMFDKSKPEEQK